MDNKILLFLPNSLDTRKTGYIKGFHKKYFDCDAYYITSNKIFPNYVTETVGYIGRKSKLPDIDKHLLILSATNNIVFIDNIEIDSNCLVPITYDYYGFKNSDMINFEGNYGRHFHLLSSILQKKESNNVHSNIQKLFWQQIQLTTIWFLNILLWILSKMKYVCKCSATFQHFKEVVISMKMTFQDLHHKGPNPILCNNLSAKCTDMIIGLFALNYFLTYESYIVEAVQVFIDEIIYNLKKLLLYLMGSPIGLKLNHSFNNALGQFFFYHISLWKVFLLTLRPIFITHFRYLVLPGALGLSFQMAMILDVISVATFHVYCIYVYAARLFNLQLKGLISLWRLFIGKKYNPLRKRVDSCQYSPNQLFIGTLGFTIFLFLLPTTIMYYTVFFMFRLVILIVNGVLLRFMYVLKAIPVYTFVLWIKRSPSLKGSICMTWKNCHENTVPKIEVKLNILPLMQCIRSCMPTNNEPPKSLGNILHSVITGALL